MSGLYPYTDEYRDDESGLMYYNSRYYDTDLKRFTSVDPWAGDISNPQSLNKYSYVVNNPLTYSDPTGESPEDTARGALQGGKEFASGVKNDLVYAASHPIQTGIGALRAIVDGYSQAGAFLGEASVNGGQMASEIKQGYGAQFNQLMNAGDEGVGYSISLMTLGTMYNAIGGKYIKGSNATWGNSNTLADHTNRHGADFGTSDPETYARLANEFKTNGGNSGIRSFTNNDGVTKMYDPSTNTFGSYNRNGTTKTFYKPDPAKHKYATNLDYWNAQK